MEAAKCAAFLLLALFSCLEIVSIEGRPFSTKNEASMHDVIEASPKRELGDEGSSQQQHTNPNHIASPMTPQTASDDKEAFRPTTPGNSPGVGHKFSESREESDHVGSPMTPQSAFKDDFRPTTPGNSPGVGHKFTKSREQSEAKHTNPNHVASPMTPQNAFKDDFRPTTPGNSPGVGHEFTKSREQSEAKGRNLVASNEIEDYRPTTPGHSPGVGHKIQVKNVKPSP